MPEGQPEGPRDGEEKYEANPKKAVDMAYAMNADTILANIANNTLRQKVLAAELLQTADDRGKEAGETFDNNEQPSDQWAAQKAIATSVFIHDEDQETLTVVSDKTPPSPVRDMGIGKFYGLLGTKEPSLQERQYSASTDTAVVRTTELGIFISERSQQDESGKLSLTLELSKKDPLEQ